MHIQWKRHNEVNLVENIIVIIALFLGIIGQIILILSLFFPWRLYCVCHISNGCWFDKLSFSLLFSNEFYPLSYLIEIVFGLMITIGLFLIWWRKRIQLFSSLIVIGIMILPSRIFILLLFFVKYDFTFGHFIISSWEYYLKDSWGDIGAYMNLTATIFLIIMVGLSILGLILSKNKINKSRVYDVKGISVVCLCSLLVISPVFLSNYSWVEEGRSFFILITIPLLLTTFIKDTYSRKIIIPIFMMILGIELLLPELLRLAIFDLSHFFIINASLALIILGLLMFNNNRSKFKLKDQLNLVSHNKRIRILNPIFLLKFLSGIYIILLLSCLVDWFFIEEWLVLKDNPQAIIFLWVLSPSLMLVIFSSLIQGIKNRRLETHIRKPEMNYMFLYIYFIGVLMYVYLIFYVFFYSSLSEGLKEIFNPFNSPIISLFLLIDMILIPFNRYDSLRFHYKTPLY